MLLYYFEKVFNIFRFLLHLGLALRKNNLRIKTKAEEEESVSGNNPQLLIREA